MKYKIEINCFTSEQAKGIKQDKFLVEKFKQIS